LNLLAPPTVKVPDGKNRVAPDDSAASLNPLSANPIINQFITSN
jgi:hypothetical protein